MFEGGTTELSLSKVIWMRERPVPRMSRNCLGLDVRDIGQNLVPTPPAIITAKCSEELLMSVKVNTVIRVTSATPSGS